MEHESKHTFGWWRFGGSNLQAEYGYGSAADADHYCDRLNAGRKINMYGAHWMGETDSAAGIDPDCGFNLS